MEWRCEWCGKPHETDDPPCDHCGHGKFEKAIVRQTERVDDPDTTTVWVCTECGREHPKNSPPCSRCTNATLERREKRVDESNLTAVPGTGRDSFEAESTTVWVCPACEREHPRHSPPCSRCGHTTLDAREKRVDDDELSTPGYLDLVTPQYAVALVAVLLLAGLFVLGFLGVVDLPGFPSNDVPAVEDVPGNESTANGVSLAAVEERYVEAINDEREDRNANRLERNDWLDDVATFANQHWVRQTLAGGDPPETEEVRDLLGQECRESATSNPARIPLEATDETEIAEQLASAVVDEDGWEPDPGMELTGVDVHSAEGMLYLTQYVCV